MRNPKEACSSILLHLMSSVKPAITYAFSMQIIALLQLDSHKSCWFQTSLKNHLKHLSVHSSKSSESSGAARGPSLTEALMNEDPTI